MTQTWAAECRNEAHAYGFPNPGTRRHHQLGKPAVKGGMPSPSADCSRIVHGSSSYADLNDPKTLRFDQSSFRSSERVGGVVTISKKPIPLRWGRTRQK